NQISGYISSEIGNLINLEILYLQNNQISGSIPAEIGNLTNLERLKLFDNQFTGSIPTEIGNLTNLVQLELMGNQLSGDIPSEIGNLTNLYSLWLRDNQLSGEIPSEIGNLTNLDQLYLSGNQLYGEIPSEICNISSLNIIEVHNNNLCPIYPECLSEEDIGDQITSNCVSVEINGTSGFRMLSSPVSGNIYSDLLDELWTQGMAGSDDPNHGAPNVWTWTIASEEDTFSWQPITDLDTTYYHAGTGILVYVFADTDFNGVEDDLPVTLSVSGAGTYQNTVKIPTTENSFNLLGNPYGWTLDISQLWPNNSDFNSTVYVWDNAISAYRNYNGQAGDIADGLLAPFQGFWVEADAGADTFSFNMATISDEQG
ncbi:uncharacterized protein METZ01_LOCUS311532, partial [marine metagenome]